MESNGFHPKDTPDASLHHSIVGLPPGGPVEGSDFQELPAGVGSAGSPDLF
jgi:hypothetical protein